MTVQPTTAARSGRSRWEPLTQALLIVALFAGVGAACGWLWVTVWKTPSGVVFDGTWYADEAALRAEFPSTGWFIVISVVAGLLLGGLCALVLARAELVTLGAVLVGAVLATYLMWSVGLALSPEDPQVLAATTADGGMLPAQIGVSGRSPFLLLTAAALLSLAVTFAVLPPRRHRAEAA